MSPFNNRKTEIHRSFMELFEPVSIYVAATGAASSCLNHVVGCW